MKKITKQKALILTITGLLVITTSQVYTHYIVISDFAKGSFFGIGIGLLLIAVVFGNLSSVKY